MDTIAGIMDPVVSTVQGIADYLSNLHDCAMLENKTIKPPAIQYSLWDDVSEECTLARASVIPGIIILIIVGLVWWSGCHCFGSHARKDRKTSRAAAMLEAAPEKRDTHTAPSEAHDDAQPSLPTALNVVVHTAQQDLEDLNRAVHMLVDENTTLRTALDNVTVDNEVAKALRGDLEQRSARSMAAVVDRLDSVSAKLQDERDGAQRRIVELGKERDEAVGKMERCAASEGELRRDLDDVTSERDELQAQLAETIDTAAEISGTLNAKGERLQKELDDARQGLETVRSQVEQEAGEKTTLQEENNTLQEQLTVLKDKSDDLKQESLSLELEYQNVAKARDSELAAHEGALQEKDEQIASLEQAIAKKDEEIKQQKRERADRLNDQGEKHKKDVTKRLNDARKAWEEDTEQEKTEMLGKVAELEKQLEESRSEARQSEGEKERLEKDFEAERMKLQSGRDQAVAEAETRDQEKGDDTDSHEAPDTSAASAPRKFTLDPTKEFVPSNHSSQAISQLHDATNGPLREQTSDHTSSLAISRDDPRTAGLSSSQYAAPSPAAEAVLGISPGAPQSPSHTRPAAPTPSSSDFDGRQRGPSVAALQKEERNLAKDTPEGPRSRTPRTLSFNGSQRRPRLRGSFVVPTGQSVSDRSRRFENRAGSGQSVLRRGWEGFERGSGGM